MCTNILTQIRYRSNSIELDLQLTSRLASSSGACDSWISVPRCIQRHAAHFYKPKAAKTRAARNYYDQNLWLNALPRSEEWIALVAQLFTLRVSAAHGHGMTHGYFDKG